MVFASFLPVDVSTASLEQRGAALGAIIWLFTGMIAGIALLVWWVVPESDIVLPAEQRTVLSFSGVRKVFKMPAIWLQAIIVVCKEFGRNRCQLFDPELQQDIWETVFALPQ